ncbi:MAG: helix-turn-helix transcriptional regulator [Oscillospiraceae bacterium]|nr:helix-turn-helix transcriptional regulator [Oscillospiraceae bacterium]
MRDHKKINVYNKTHLHERPRSSHAARNAEAKAHTNTTNSFKRRTLGKEMEDIMLQMEKIGSYIARLRKANGLTQGKLADKLSVSHQAVSNWERGDSLPDASQWIPLSRALGTSVDLLLYGGELPDDEPDAREADSEADSKEAAPPPSVMIHREDEGDEDDEDEDEGEDDANEDEVEYETDEDDDDDETEAFASFSSDDEPSDDYWDQVIAFAPHMSREGLDQLVLSIMSGPRPNWSVIRKLAPFLSRESLDRLARMACDPAPDWDELRKLAPFLSRSALGELAKMAYEEAEPNWHALRKLAPFLSKSDLANIVEQCVENLDPDLDELVKLAPYLSRESLSMLLAKALNGQTPQPRLLRKLAPFLPRRVLDDLVLHCVNNKKWSPHFSGADSYGGSDKRGDGFPWHGDVKEMFDTVQREVTSAMQAGQENLQQARESLRDALGWLFNPDDRD